MPYLRRGNIRRSTLLLHLYWSYLNRLQKLQVSESLRLMWNAVPETFLGYEEIAAVFELEGYSPKQIDDIYEFYTEAVDEFESKVEPRTLKHHCRTVIRRRLFRYGHWLPEGIRQLGFPPKLQAYLNLE